MSEPSAELAALVAQLRVTNAGLREVIAGQAAQLEAQAARIAELERRLSSDSATSSKPPSSGLALPQTGPGIVANLLGTQAW